MSADSLRFCSSCEKFRDLDEMYNNIICKRCVAKGVEVNWTCKLCGRSYLDRAENIPQDRICVECINAALKRIKENMQQEPTTPSLERNEVSQEAGGTKYDQDKPRFDLIPPESLFAIAEVLTFGAQKYGDRNWEKGIRASRLFAAVQRHLWKWWSGRDTDEESGLSHLSHAICGLAMLLTTIQRNSGLDDRPGKEGNNA